MSHEHKWQMLDGLFVCPDCGQIKKPKKEKKKRTFLKQKKVVVNYPRSTITISTEEKIEWKKIKGRGRYSWNGLLHLVRLEYLKLESLKDELQEANATLRQIALKQATPFTVMGVGTNIQPINRLKPPPSFPSATPEALKLSSNKAEVVYELKQKFVETENVMSLLTSVNPQDLAEVHSRQVHHAIIEGTYRPN